MMLKIKFLSIIFLSIACTFSDARACSCAYGGEFSTYAYGTTVISGKVIQYGPKLGHGESLYQDMEVEVSSVIQGEFTHKTVKLLGDPGHLCRPYIDSNKYKLNSTFLIALSGTAQVQAFMGCGESAVLLEENIVYGKKYSNGKYIDYQLSYDQILKQLSSKHQ